MSKERADIIRLVADAQTSGARQSKACEIIGISAKTVQRWLLPDNVQEGRLDAKHEPANKLTAWERQRLIKVANEPAYADLPPNKLVPKLADEGRYLVSESTFYRVLKENHRQKAKPTRQVKKPESLTATGPDQLYSWDMTYLPTLIKGLFLYLYLVNVPFIMNYSRYMDIYSRKIVGWQVAY